MRARAHLSPPAVSRGALYGLQQKLSEKVKPLIFFFFSSFPIINTRLYADAFSARASLSVSRSRLRANFLDDVAGE